MAKTNPTDNKHVLEQDKNDLKEAFNAYTEQETNKDREKLLTKFYRKKIATIDYIFEQQKYVAGIIKTIQQTADRYKDNPPITGIFSNPGMAVLHFVSILGKNISYADRAALENIQTLSQTALIQSLTSIDQTALNRINETKLSYPNKRSYQEAWNDFTIACNRIHEKVEEFPVVTIQPTALSSKEAPNTSPSTTIEATQQSAIPDRKVSPTIPSTQQAKPALSTTTIDTITTPTTALTESPQENKHPQTEGWFNYLVVSPAQWFWNALTSIFSNGYG